MPAQPNEMMTARGLITVLGWDSWDCEHVNIDVRINSYGGHISHETWYAFPVEHLENLGLEINTQITKNGVY